MLLSTIYGPPCTLRAPTATCRYGVAHVVLFAYAVLDIPARRIPPNVPEHMIPMGRQPASAVVVRGVLQAAALLLHHGASFRAADRFGGLPRVEGAFVVVMHAHCCLLRSCWAV